MLGSPAAVAVDDCTRGFVSIVCDGDTAVTAVALGFATSIVPLTTAFRAVEPVCVTSTFHSTVPVSPCFMLS